MGDELVATVACGGLAHRVAVRGADLVALDHDEEAERALAALGGDEPACTWLVGLWRSLDAAARAALAAASPEQAAARAAGFAAALAGLEAVCERYPSIAAARAADLARLRADAALWSLPAPVRAAARR